MGIDAGIAKNGLRSGINITPLIDVVLVLLIIFMVLTPSMLKHVTVKVPPPANPAQVVDPLAPPLVLGYTARRELTINSDPVDWASLGAVLAQRLRTRADKVVFLEVEDDVNYGESVRLMDTARGAGARILALGARK